MKTIYLPLIFCAIIFISEMPQAQTTTVNYTASTDDFANPERGFYRYSETLASNYTTLDSAELASYRNLHSPAWNAEYDVYSTLVFRYFILDEFVNSNISQSFLNNMEVDFAVARAAGVKLIPRFAYTIGVVAGGCPVGWVCPPYGDASKAQVLAHIAQIKPILQANADVIAVLQMGFIGIWGENYYTDHFGDASPNGLGHLADSNWTDRKDILTALLDAMPTNRQVQVRYPQMKQKYVYGNAAATTVPPLTPVEAHDGSDKSRIAFHNDCLMASPADFGTFTNYDNPPTDDTTNLKPYFANGSKYLAVGGETCWDGYNPFNNCTSTGGSAEQELRRLHYSYLNSQYNNDVNNDWVSGNCMEGIKRQLGYRFVLQSGTYSNEAQPGQSISVDIDLVNDGYAAPFNPRGAELVLQNTSTNETWFAKLADDPRFWLGEGAAHSIAATLCIPTDMPLGSYKLLLHLPDPMASIYGRPEYAIRLANNGVWDPTTGYNDLGHTVAINSTAPNAACNGNTGFIMASAYSDVCAQNLTIAGVSIPTGQYHSDGDMSLTGASVLSGASVLLQSDSGVTLGMATEVEIGGELNVVIGACGGN